MKEDVKMCSQCIMHTGIPYIQINEKGLCSDCEDWIEEKKQQVFGEASIPELTKKMETLFEKVRKENRTYDALVLFSGGKDSTQLVTWAKENYGLNVLAFTMELPIGKKLAIENVAEVCKKMNIESMKVSPDESMYKRYMKYALLYGYKYGLAEDSGCGACSFLFRWYSTRLAMEMNIPIILDGRDKWQYGGSLYKEGDMQKAAILKGEKPFGRLHDLFKDALNGEYEKSMYGYDLEYLKNKKFPDFIAPFTFIEYDTLESLNTIDKLGLDRNNFETMFTNCDGVYLFDYININRYNCFTYHRGYAHGLRQNIPTIEQMKTDNSDNKATNLSKEQTIKALDEYKNVLNYIGDNKIDKNGLTEYHREQIENMIPFSKTIYGDRCIDFMLERALKLSEFAEYFDLTLSKEIFEIDAKLSFN